LQTRITSIWTPNGALLSISQISIWVSPEHIVINFWFLASKSSSFDVSTTVGRPILYPLTNILLVSVSTLPLCVSYLASFVYLLLHFMLFIHQSSFLMLSKESYCCPCTTYPYHTVCLILSSSLVMFLLSEPV
jgi:hypothetical protein